MTLDAPVAPVTGVRPATLWWVSAFLCYLAFDEVIARSGGWPLGEKTRMVVVLVALLAAYQVGRRISLRTAAVVLAMSAIGFALLVGLPFIG